MKIIEITKQDDLYSCLVCGERDESILKKLEIKRKITSNGIVSFAICNNCLLELKNELYTMED